MDIETIENAIGELRNTDSVLLIDCQMPKSQNSAKTQQGSPKKYKTFADEHPECLEVEGIYSDCKKIRILKPLQDFSLGIHHFSHFFQIRS